MGLNYVKKRFIAGAECPRCHHQDTLRWWLENNAQIVECVDCGFSEQHNSGQEKAATENANSRTEQEIIAVFRPE